MSTFLILSLNPYYTGIHLHDEIEAVGLYKEICLNPYYTGIHLHKSLKRYGYSYCCLNPYYTGIHLHLIFDNLVNHNNVS